MNFILDALEQGVDLAFDTVKCVSQVSAVLLVASLTLAVLASPLVLIWWVLK